MSSSTPEVDLETKITEVTQELIEARQYQVYRNNSIANRINKLTGAQIKQVFKELRSEQERISALSIQISETDAAVRKAVMENE